MIPEPSEIFQVTRLVVAAFDGAGVRYFLSSDKFVHLIEADRFAVENSGFRAIETKPGLVGRCHREFADPVCRRGRVGHFYLND